MGKPLSGHDSAITAVTVTERAGRRLIVSGSADKTVRLWDLQTGQVWGKPLRGHKNLVTTVAVTEHADGG